MFTRDDYLANNCNHNEYYQQFVTYEILQVVERVIGKNRILQSKYPHFNDIPLKNWDILSSMVTFPVSTYKAMDHCFGSLSDKNCVLKQAARMIKERQ